MKDYPLKKIKPNIRKDLKRHRKRKGNKNKPIAYNVYLGIFAALFGYLMKSVVADGPSLLIKCRDNNMINVLTKDYLSPIVEEFPLTLRKYKKWMRHNDEAITSKRSQDKEEDAIDLILISAPKKTSSYQLEIIPKSIFWKSRPYAIQSERVLKRLNLLILAAKSEKITLIQLNKIREGESIKHSGHYFFLWRKYLFKSSSIPNLDIETQY